MLLLSVPGPGHPSDLHGGALSSQVPVTAHATHSAFPSPTSQFVRDLVERLLHAGTATSDRCRTA